MSTATCRPSARYGRKDNCVPSWAVYQCNAGNSLSAMAENGPVIAAALEGGFEVPKTINPATTLAPSSSETRIETRMRSIVDLPRYTMYTQSGKRNNAHDAPLDQPLDTRKDPRRHAQAHGERARC